MTLQLGSMHINPRFGILALLVLAFFTGTICGLSFFLFRPNNVAAVFACHFSQAPSGAYTITLCITSPSDHATLSGDVPVSVGVSMTGRHPDVQQYIYSLDDQPVPVQASDDGSFILATDQFRDGPHVLQISARMTDGFVPDPAKVEVNFNNGNSDSVAQSSPTAPNTALLAAPTLASPTPTVTASPTVTITPPPSATTRRVLAPTRAPRAPAASTPTMTVAPTATPDTSTNTDTTGGSNDTVDNSNGNNDGSSTCVGSISGHVTSNGAPVPNVNLTMVDGANVSTDMSPTDSTGYYLFPGLVDGNYAVAIAVPQGLTALPPSATRILSFLRARRAQPPR